MDTVPTEDIERIVGAERHPTEHLARAVSKEQRIYLLHSHECFASTPDLRECRYSQAMVRMDATDWEFMEDCVVEVAIDEDEALVPLRVVSV